MKPAVAARVKACAGPISRPPIDARKLRASLRGPPRRAMGTTAGEELSFFWHDLDLEKLGPEFAGDEEPVGLCVVGDAVEDGLGI